MLARHEIIAERPARSSRPTSTTPSSPSPDARPAAPPRSCHERAARAHRHRGQAGCSASRITWLAAIALPTVILLIFGSIFGPQRPRSRARRPALHRRVRAVARRDHGGDARHPGAAHPPRDLPREGRASTPLDHARRIPSGSSPRSSPSTWSSRSSRWSCSSSSRTSRSACRSLVSRSATCAAFLLGMTSLFAIGLLVAAVAPSNRAATAIAIPMFFAVMFLGGVYLPRVVPPGRPRPDRRLHAPRRPGPAGRVDGDRPAAGAARRDGHR